MKFYIQINNFSKNVFWEIEITENYEGDKWHAEIMEIDGTDYHYSGSKGFDTEKQVFDYMRELENFVPTEHFAKLPS